MKGYHDKHGVELHEGDYIRFSENGNSYMLYEWEDEYGNKGLGTDATNPHWIATGRAVPCEFGIYNLNYEDMKTCERVGNDPTYPSVSDGLRAIRNRHS